MDEFERFKADLEPGLTEAVQRVRNRRAWELRRCHPRTWGEIHWRRTIKANIDRLRRDTERQLYGVPE